MAGRFGGAKVLFLVGLATAGCERTGEPANDAEPSLLAAPGPRPNIQDSPEDATAFGAVEGPEPESDQPAGDGADGTVNTLDPEEPGVSLTPYDDCGDLEQRIKETMTAEMERQLAEQEAWAISSLDWMQWFYCYETEEYYAYEADCGPDGLCLASNYNAGDTSRDAAASEYTTTNNQVASVDEADFIKNDGSYIYLVSGDRLMILKAWPVAELEVVASVQVPGSASSLYVTEDRAVVFSRVTPCELGIGQTLLSVFDISDRSAPRLERELLLGGDYVSSRRIDSDVYVVLESRSSVAVQLTLSPVPFWLYSCDATEATIRDAFAALAEENRRLIREASLDALIPSIRDVDYEAGAIAQERVGPLAGCETFLAAPGDATGLLSLVALSLDDDQSLGTAVITGVAGTVYASSGHLYIAASSHDIGQVDTLVHRFTLAGGTSAPTYDGSGLVPGRLVNQLAMDEWDGFLRVATTVGHIPTSVNGLYVLGPPGPTGLLPLVGSITGIAPTEDVRSVRFDGPRGFIVTFKKTDPLYAFDLSDPTAPVITGELEIPGFSTYMHMMDEDHLLTIGFDAEEMGSFAWFQGVMLQVFDISDPEDPTLLHREIIGTRGTTSDATANHLAFTYLASRNLLALPIGICEESAGGGTYGRELTFNGLLVYRVTVEGGFTRLGGVDHRDPSDLTLEYGPYGCYNWWQNPRSLVKRSIIMADSAAEYVYSASLGLLKGNDVTALDVDLVTQELLGATLSPACVP